MRLRPGGEGGGLPQGEGTVEVSTPTHLGHTPVRLYVCYKYLGLGMLQSMCQVICPKTRPNLGQVRLEVPYSLSVSTRTVLEGVSQCRLR